MENGDRLENLQHHVFNNTWNEIYKESFEQRSVKAHLLDDMIIQVIVWNKRYQNFYPSYPISSSSLKNKDLKEYREYINGNYSTFSFAKFIQKNNIQQEIRILLYQEKNEIKHHKDSITISINAQINNIHILTEQLNNLEEIKIKGYPSIRELTLYFEKLYKLLGKFNFKTIIIQPILNRGDRVIGVLSLYSEIEDYHYHGLDQLTSLLSQEIHQLSKAISSAERKKRKKEEEKEKIRIRNVISSIMSRNISHNIGSHVLVNVEKHMENTPIVEHKKLINYILERMNFITQVSTLWSPEWSLPRFFKREIIQQFLEQKHLLYNIATADGLEYKEREANNYYIVSKESDSETKHSFQIVDGKASGSSKNQDQQDDVLVDIPGGKIGYHAIYTIIENILRNSAKYGYATLSYRYQKKKMELNITIDEESNDHKHKVEVWDNVSYISNLTHSFDPKWEEIKQQEIKVLTIQEIPEEPFIQIVLRIKEEQITLYVHKTKTVVENNSWLLPPSKHFNYEEKLQTKNTFFISQARFHSILKSLGDTENRRELIYQRSKNILSRGENLKKFVLLLRKRVFNPLHHAINQFLTASLIDNENDLNKNNGLSEIKICALYLSGADYRDLAKDKKRDYIKAIAKKEYDEEGNLLCYRLGYEFLLNKPTVYSLCLSSQFREKLSFIEQCSDESFVLLKEVKKRTLLRTSPKIISSEFLIYDFKKFEESILKLSKEESQDKLNRLPYRIIVLIDGKSDTLDKYTQPFIRKRVAQLDISHCRDKEKFKEKILNAWIEHTLKVNQHNSITTMINLNGTQRESNTNNMLTIGENLLKSFSQKLLEDDLITTTQHKNLLKIIQYESKSILTHTDFQKFFNLNEGERPLASNTTTDTHLGSTHFSYALKKPHPSFTQKSILLSRHIKSKSRAKEALGIDNPLVYYESLSGETNQFWLYQHMFQTDSIAPTELLFNKLKLLETALYKIALFDERLLTMIESQTAEDQGLYMVNEINGYQISNFSNGLSGAFENEELLLTQDQKRVNIDILIVHYGLLEKIKDNSKLSEKKLEKLLFSFPMVVLTSGRGIVLSNKTRKNGHIKFISFPILKEYFRHNAINKIGLTQMLMNLIGIKNNLSGLYDA